MALRDQLEQSGVWLFRWRSYLPLALLAFVIPAFWGFDFPEHSRSRQNVWEAFCFLISFAGIVVRAIVVGRAPSGTSGRTTRRGPMAPKLITTGPYSIVRHPLYVGNYLMWLGVALMPRSPWLLVSVSLAFWLYYERIMLAEEAFLREQFGEEFERWASTTPAFIPSFSSWKRGEAKFSWRNMLRREYSGWLALTSCLAAMDFAASYVATGSVRLLAFGPLAMLVSLGPYLVVLVLDKRTTVLRVPGY
jgi:protein-S-isoprenylcysteine O-methyltransferase Ste14